MDAATLYMIVQLANGDVRTAMEVPLPSAQHCREAARSMGGGKVMHDYFRSGAKRVAVYCSSRPEPVTIAR